MSEALLDSGELAEFLNCTQIHVYSLVQRGLPHRRLGPGAKAPYRFVLSEVMEWLGRCGGGAVQRQDRAHRPAIYRAEYLK